MEPYGKLLNRLIFTVPGMEEAGKAFTAGDYSKAMEAVAEHFRTRKSPQYLFTAEEAKKLQDPGILRDAQEVLDHTIYGHHFEGDIDWDFNPTADTSRDKEWTWSLYRHIYWQALARAYAQTGDEKYTEEFLAEMKSWAESCPVTPFMTDTYREIDKNYPFPGHSWRTLEAGMRMFTSWLPALEIFRSSPRLDADAWYMILSRICDHGDFLVKQYSNHSHSSNWLTMESAGLLECGILFPEIRSDWFATGYRRVVQEVKYSWDNDGIHMERTPVYHLCATNAYFQCYLLLKANGFTVPPYMLPTLKKAAQFLVSIVKPDLTTPMIGDADCEDLKTRRTDTSLYEGMNLTFDPLDLNELRAFFRKMYETTGDPEFLYMAACRKEGKAPEKTDYAYPGAGIYIMRTGWGDKDTCFHVHGIQLERGEVSTHSHNDTGHVEISIRGENILTDSGRYVYNSSCWKDWRHYFLSAKAHNTLYIDDHEMGSEPGIYRVRGVRTYLHEFTDNPEVQLIDISHNGYAYMDDPMFHRRRVFRFPGDIFIIWDRLTGICQKDHDIRLYYNFYFGSLTDHGEGRFSYISKAGNPYDVSMSSDSRFSSDILCGSVDPIGGWYSGGYMWKKPIPQLIFQHIGRAPLTCVTILQPAGSGAYVRGISAGQAAVALPDGKTLELYEDRYELV